MKIKLLVLLSLLVLVNLLIPSEVEAYGIKIKKYNLRSVLATHTTYFKNSDKERSSNIKLAAQKIDGRVIKAGDSFSFNQVVGPRTKERGFKESAEIVNNEYVTGVGGGVCQVSSTLYNSVLFAGLEIIERKNHSRPVTYVPLGRGATVYYDLIDFKFKNNFSHPIMIMAKVVDKQLTITLLGKDPGIDVKVVTSAPQTIDPEVIEKSDSDLEQGNKEVVQKSKVGYKVRTRRVIKSDSKIIEDELISEDIYPPINKIIKVNPQHN
ncbi:MAG: VanW family protein [Halanaerobacter sp.]